VDVLMISTTGALPISRETFQALRDWVESGRGGAVAVHSATDTALAFEGGEDEWARFVGGRFLSHPWTQGTPVRLKAIDPDHPLAASWAEDPLVAEEIYQYEAFDPEEVRVLQTLDMSYGPLRRPWSVPVTWVKRIGAGRVFYTNLGHTPSTWEDPRFRRQLLDAVLWAAGRGDAPADPNPEAQAVAAAEAFLAARDLATSPEAVRRLADQADDIDHLQALEHGARAEGEEAYREAIERLTDTALGRSW
jgi:type 1 glutamine amidotransferase